MKEQSSQLYDDLHPFYQSIWGGSLHHGLWQSGKERVDEALEELTRHCLTVLAPEPDQCIADIGCGYGFFSKRIRDDYRCQVFPFTNSAKQAEKAVTPVIQSDWLEHELPVDSLDSAIALESLSHFPSFSDFFTVTSKPLRPGGRIIIADWFADPECSRTETILLSFLARAGAIPAWRTLEELEKSAPQFYLENVCEFSTQVAPTWRHMFRQSVLLPFKSPSLILPAMWQVMRRPALPILFPLLGLAYRSGALRYFLIDLRLRELK